MNSNSLWGVGDGNSTNPNSGDIIDKESIAYLGITVCVCVLVVGTLIVHLMRYFNVSHTVCPDSWIFLAIGVIVSIILQFNSHVARIVDAIDASFAEIFFTVLLPPIIFQSGLELNASHFVKRFSSFSVFAFLGTAVSAFFIGTCVFLTALLPFLPSFTYPQALMLGTILSATDTVAVIAVFEKLHVDEELYALVFGESVFNDAVAIVMYRTLSSYEDNEVTAGSVFVGLGMFVVNFLGSTLIGVITGVLTALLFKHVKMHRQKTALDVEKALLMTSPLVAYMLSEGLQISGVVAILFTGITMNLFTLKNVSRGSSRFVRDFYRVFAMIAEALTFVYIGIALPLLGSQGMKTGWLIAIGLLLFCLVARGCSTWLCSVIVNHFRSANNKIGKPSQFIIWMAGLRGGVAFALASAAADIIKDTAVGEIFPPATLLIILASMLGISTSIGHMIRRCGLQGAGAGQPTAPVENSIEGHALPSEGTRSDQNEGSVSASPVINDRETPIPDLLSGPDNNDNTVDEVHHGRLKSLSGLAHQAAEKLVAVANATLVRKQGNPDGEDEGVELLGYKGMLSPKAESKAAPQSPTPPPPQP